MNVSLFCLFLAAQTVEISGYFTERTHIILARIWRAIYFMSHIDINFFFAFCVCVRNQSKCAIFHNVFRFSTPGQIETGNFGCGVVNKYVVLNYSTIKLWLTTLAHFLLHLWKWVNSNIPINENSKIPMKIALRIFQQLFNNWNRNSSRIVLLLLDSSFLARHGLNYFNIGLKRTLKWIFVCTKNQ